MPDQATPWTNVSHLQINKLWIDCSVREQHVLGAQCSQFAVEEGPDISDHVRDTPDGLRIEGIITNTPIGTRPAYDGDPGLVQRSLPLTTADGQPLEFNQFVGYQSHQLEGPPNAGYFSLVPIIGATTLPFTNYNDLPKKKLNMLVAEYEFKPLGVAGYSWQYLAETNRVKFAHDTLRATFKARQPITVITGLHVYEKVILTELNIQRDASSGPNALMFTASGQVIRIVKSTTGQPVPSQDRATPAVSKGAQNAVPTKPGEVPESTKHKGSVVTQALDGAANWFNQAPPEP